MADLFSVLAKRLESNAEHPRTLDYRLRRVRNLTCVDPASVHGVRVLTTAVRVGGQILTRPDHHRGCRT